MKKPTKSHIEAVSNLLQACRLCGASFRTGLATTITMPDGTLYKILERQVAWQFSHQFDACTFDTLIPKKLKAPDIQLALLKFHVKVLDHIS